MTRRRLVTGAGVLGLYAVLVVTLTWPLAARITTHLPDTHKVSGYDPLFTAWVLAWESHALTTGAPFTDTNVYHPARGTLFYSDTAFGALPIFMPAFLASGNPAFASNLLLLVTVILSAAALHLVAWHWTGSHTAALVAGWTTLMAPWTLWEFNPTAPSEGMLPYLPFIVLLAARERPRVWPLLVLTLLQCLTDVAYIAAVTLGPLLALAGLRLARRRTRPAGVRLLAVVGLTALGLLPVHLQHLAVRAANPGIATQTLWLVPAPRMSLPWEPLLEGPMAVPVAVFALVAVGAALRLLMRRAPLPGWGPALFWTVMGLLLTLPPLAKWNGRAIVLPHAFVDRWTPIYKILRVTIRLGVGGQVGLALLAAVACAECGRRLPARVGPVFALLVAAVMFGEYAWDGTRLPGRYPLMLAPTDPAPILAVLREPGGPLLDVPVGTRGDWDPSNHARAEFRSTRHWRPILNGYTSYWPVGFPQRMELAYQLPDPSALAALRAQTGLALVLVHLDEFQWRRREYCRHETDPREIEPGSCDNLGAGLRARWESVAASERRDLRLVARTDDTLLFAVTP